MPKVVIVASAVLFCIALVWAVFGGEEGVARDLHMSAFERKNRRRSDKKDLEVA